MDLDPCKLWALSWYNVLHFVLKKHEGFFISLWSSRKPSPPIRTEPYSAKFQKPLQMGRLTPGWTEPGREAGTAGWLSLRALPSLWAPVSRVPKRGCPWDAKWHFSRPTTCSSWQCHGLCPDRTWMVRPQSPAPWKHQTTKTSSTHPR